MLLSFISLGIVTITSIVLSYFLIQLNRKYKELQIKLKVTRDFADRVSIELGRLKVKSNGSIPQSEQKPPYKKTRRSPRKKSNGNNEKPL